MKAIDVSVTLALLLVTVIKGLTQSTISQQPANQSLSIGANVTVSVGASRTPPLVYHWHFNDTALGNATNRTLVLKTTLQIRESCGYERRAFNRAAEG